ncbi:DUF6542 domain-containing protein [Saccharopolyspora erythraea]|uniref:DUF6542 domain-containing protein n=4 Tax=Saccharopolyspora erythraea TaxID=1836 RepID=UPI001EFBFD03|nr:DUF6542 domain-containing protein [Saccharopolyspora erythraea]
MTATRERPDAPAPDNGAPSWSELSAFGTTRGVPLWGALLLAAVPTAVGTLLDILIWSQPGLLFKACFFVGSMLAVAFIKRANMFGPMVQPPLVLAMVMPVLVLLTGSGTPKDGGLAAKALAVVNPLIGSFPVMAATTALAVVIGLLRMYVLQRSPHANAEAATKRRPLPKLPPEDGDTPTRKQAAEGRAKRSADRDARRDARRDAKLAAGSAKMAEREAKRPPEGGAKRPPERDPRRGAAKRGDERGAGRPARDGDPRARGQAPGRGARGADPRGRAGDPRAEREGRAVPPGRGAQRPAPGRGRPPEPKAEPPRRPRRPRRDDSFE